MVTPPPGSLAIALLRASDWFNDALLTRLTARGWPPLNRTQSLTFAHLGGDTARPAELARRVGISRQSMQKLLEDLVTHDLVAVAPDPEDGRATVVQLTARGRRMGRSAAAILAELEDELAARIGTANLTRLRAVMACDWGPTPR